MRKWEYQAVQRTGRMPSLLMNNWGAAGWRLIQVIPSGDSWEYLWEREVVESEDYPGKIIDDIYAFAERLRDGSTLGGACKTKEDDYIEDMSTHQETADMGKVRLGGMSPAFGHNTVDASKVRLGGMSPSLATTLDAGKVRLGGMSPSLKSDKPVK